MENSRFKFRAWEGRVMRTFDKYENTREFPNECLSDFFDDNFGCQVMQYTGLKDKNDVEIYEGDILSNNGDIHTVGFQDGCFLMIEETIHNAEIEPLYKFFFEEYEGTDLEVVGNIYENKELLSNKA